MGSSWCNLADLKTFNSQRLLIADCWTTAVLLVTDNPYRICPLLPPLVKLQSRQHSTLLIGLLNMINWVFKWVSFFQNFSLSCTCSCPYVMLLFSQYHLELFPHLMHSCDFLGKVFSRSLIHSLVLFAACMCSHIIKLLSVLCVHMAVEHHRSLPDLLLLQWYTYSEGLLSQFCRWTSLAAYLDTFVCFIFNTVLRWNIFSWFVKQDYGFDCKTMTHLSLHFSY